MAAFLSFLLLFPEAARAPETAHIDFIKNVVELNKIDQEIKYRDKILTASVLTFCEMSLDGLFSRA